MKLWKDLGNGTIVLTAALFVVFVTAGIWTRGAMQQLSFLRSGAQANELVDQRPWQTAQALAALAVSSEEQSLAQDAERLADHEVDQAFAFALRQAALQTRKLTREALALQAKVTALQQTIADDKTRVDQLTAAAQKTGQTPVDGDDLDVAKAQMGLDQDELADATADLARASGDQRAQIQQALETRQAAMKKFDAGLEKGQTAVISAKRYQTLWGRASAWLDQRSRVASVAQAETEARQDAAALMKQHDALEAQAATASADGMAGTARAKMLRGLAMRQTMLGLLDDQGDTDQQLAGVYQKWQAQIWLQHRIVGHLLLMSLAVVMFLILLAATADLVGTRLIQHLNAAAVGAADLRRAHTLETILHLALQVVGLIAVLLVVFGVPSQMPTILGLATAGFTVVFQDFILAFFGWFILMGKSGIRVGDWVEIDSVGGEVTEIGLFRTTLLETGNWTSLGHPTGRRVTFINSFAIRGQYFNFSTAGQWMWDEIKINIPSGAKSYTMIEEMNKAVQKEMAASTEGAETEWKRSTQKNGLSQFNATPTVDMRPAASGVDVIVRYVTRAGERYEVANKLNQMLLGLMGEKEGAPVEPAST